MDIKLRVNPKVREAIEKELASPTPVIFKPLIGGGREDFDTNLTCPNFPSTPSSALASTKPP